MALFAAIRLARSVLLPVHALTRGTKHFSMGDLSCQVLVDVQDELGQLAHGFNDMAEKLEFMATRDGLTGLYNRR